MDKIKQITIKVQPWMAKAAVSVFFFALAYLSAATMPDYWITADGHHELTAMQGLHVAFMVVWAFGSVVSGVAAMIDAWGD